MENQHRRIRGYRELTQTEIDLMNEIKSQGIALEAVLMKVRQHLRDQAEAVEGSSDHETVERLAESEPKRWVAIAATDFQTGLMALTRAVAQPTFF